MNLHQMLQARAAAGKPLRVALIGAGKFGSMFLSQVRVTPGMHLVAVADLSPDRARAALATTGWMVRTATISSAVARTTTRCSAARVTTPSKATMVTINSSAATVMILWKVDRVLTG